MVTNDLIHFDLILVETLQQVNCINHHQWNNTQKTVVWSMWSHIFHDLHTEFGKPQLFMQRYPLHSSWTHCPLLSTLTGYKSYRQLFHQSESEYKRILVINHQRMLGSFTSTPNKEPCAMQRGDPCLASWQFTLTHWQSKSFWGQNLQWNKTHMAQPHKVVEQLRSTKPNFSSHSIILRWIS